MNSEGPLRKRVFSIYFLILMLGLVVLLAWWWFDWRGVERTDDAFIDGHIAQVSPQLAGRVLSIPVQDNQRVKRGDVLLVLDSRDEQIALQKAFATRQVDEASLAQAKASVSAGQATLEQNLANVQLAEANLLRDRKEHQRYRNSGQAVTASDLDSKAASEKVSAASLLAAQKNVDYSRAELLKSQASLAGAQATLQQDETAIEQAKLQLSYTRLYAPFDGYVTRRDAEVGDYIAAGSTLMRLVSTERWVTANFKEIQLRHMRPGQKVTVDIDAFPDNPLSARIDSMQRATGSVFNLLPAENATGNYVKVVQRIPVKIVFDPPLDADSPLSPGMSVMPEVDVR
ncbi:HlyD family secretion protein [Serratia symbiotica]|uniref:HlyD family secretion protein n=1 Tax=Serratia symbiotica TaxID=138074 RepID=A0A068Z288_9GAMM|nr:HlyD family secretion protein [Serratia symbiotica]QLH64468.1 HlyD family secretion protein [Serratia symbiotica]CDS57577.1 Membrane fusion component of tripartite multidrug resistance system [Serratia symbiotica]